MKFDNYFLLLVIPYAAADELAFSSLAWSQQAWNSVRCLADTTASHSVCTLPALA